MKNKQPAISVIIPMYKVEPYIRVCVDSVLNQTFQDFEIIIVDDASPDNCYEICRQAYGNNEKVKIIRHKQNQGLGPARNTGMDHAKGKYVYFLDSDDLILPNALEKLYEVAEQTNAEVVHMSGWYETIPNDTPVGNIQVKPHWEGEPNQQGYVSSDLRQRFMVDWFLKSWSMAWLNLYRFDFLKKYNLKFLNIISEDEPFTFALFCLAKRFLKVPFLFYIYRQRKDSIMGDENKNNIHHFSKRLCSTIACIKFMENLMNINNISSIDSNLKSFCIDRMMERFFGNYIYPKYQNGQIDKLLDEAVFEGLKPTFNENTTFVKYLFNGFNIFRQRLINLTNENQKLRSFISESINEYPYLFSIINDLKNTQNRVLLLSVPLHGNLGDQAIVLAEECAIKTVFPEHKIIEVPTKYFIGELKKFFFGLDFERYIKNDDIIFIHGGGNLGNIWPMEEEVHKDIIKRFPNNKIVIFPQSIHFTDDESGRIAAFESTQIYNAHKNLHLMCRDEASFNVAENLFPNVNKYLTPDSVTLFQGILDKSETSREGVLFVLRRDKEKVRNDQIIQSMQNYLNDCGIANKVIDTVIDEEVKTEQKRKEKVFAVLREIHQSKLVITDRFHGVIFSVITKTPVLAFKSYDTKISSGIKWFKHLPTVFYAENKTSKDMKNFIDKAIEGNAGKWNDEVNYEKILIDTLEHITNTPPLRVE